MATVTAFTAARTQAIENANIVDANIVAGELILTRFDAGTINAGPVIAAGSEPYVGQFTTGTRPAANLNNGKILWDTTLLNFYLSNGVTWEIVELGGGGGGDISSTSPTVQPAGNYWDWVLHEVTLASNSPNHVPTQGSVKAYVDANAATAQLASTDTDVIDIFTSQGITYLDVSALAGGLSGSFDDLVFEMFDTADPTKKLKFNAGAISTATTRTLTAPDADGTIVLNNNAATVTNKTFAWPTKVTGASALGLDFPVADWQQLVGPTIFGGASVFGSLASPGITFQHTGALDSNAKAPTIGGAEIMRLAARVTRDTSAFAGSDATSITAHTLEAPTATAQGTTLRFGATRIGSTTKDNVMAVLGGPSNAIKGRVTVRNGMIVGKDDVTTYPTTGYTIESADPSAAIGYGTGAGAGAGAGGQVIQQTNKGTLVTLDRPTGRITLNAANLTADTTVSFVLNNTVIDADDILIINHISGGTAGAYLLNAQCGAGVATINVRNITAGPLAEAIVLQFALIKSVVV